LPGLKLFFSILAKDFWNLVKLNLLFCACALPSAALFILGALGVLGWFSFILSIAAAFPIGGALCSCFFCVTKMIREDPGYILFDFKRKFKENMRQAMAPGILCTAFVYAQVYLWQVLARGESGILFIVTGAVSLVLFGMAAPYIFLQITYISLKTSVILKNSILFSFGYPLRSLAGALMGFAVFIAFVLLLPDSLAAVPVLLVIGFTFSWLLNLMWVWPPVDKQFSIDEVLKSRHSED